MNPARHAPALSAVLRDLGAVPLTTGAWLITSDWNARAILEQLRPIVGQDDSLLVLELGEDIASLNLDHPLLAASAALPESQNSSVN
jgi:hypothetical protein